MQQARTLVPAQGMAHPQKPDPHPPWKEVITVTVTVPLVAIAGLIVYIAWRYMGLRIWHAIVSLIFGFLLAATTAAPEIHNILAGLIQWITKP
ncbi:MAG: hypothetical protein JOY82_16490 [Streptosporangiaceae bacterium]|nr:hypothetical protein [Streptosporangiaceae bacterium]MBV9856091.1 hypothetical protein [Streptosporangiaceae bacterium]